ncbi:MAG: hypothetical protein KatS3mg051_1181 [Anaerolineae bacterium]|nr:MAG: hypothetical protein KatS3mg051_1181 [Anaerolineae bacterium]
MGRHQALTPQHKRVTILSDSGRPAQQISGQWLKLLLRLQQLPDGCHSVTIVKEGGTCRWAVTNSAAIEG